MIGNLTAMQKLSPIEIELGIIRPTPEEDAQITAAALSDPDNLPWTDEDWAKAKPYMLRGRPLLEITKQRITIRLDRRNVEKFRATGKGWQTRIDKALGEWLEANDLACLDKKPNGKKSA